MGREFKGDLPSSQELEPPKNLGRFRPRQRPAAQQLERPTSCRLVPGKSHSVGWSNRECLRSLALQRLTTQNTACGVDPVSSKTVFLLLVPSQRCKSTVYSPGSMPFKSPDVLEKGTGPGGEPPDKAIGLPMLS